MKEFIEYLLKLIVDFPDEISVVESETGPSSSLYSISANSADVGKIIGKQGKIIQAIRTVSKIIAIKENKQVRIEINPSL